MTRNRTDDSLTYNLLEIGVVPKLATISIYSNPNINYSFRASGRGAQREHSTKERTAAARGRKQHATAEV